MWRRDNSTKSSRYGTLGSMRETPTTTNTCKAQLKSIYAKTGCRSHVDLAKTLIMTALGERPAVVD